MRKWCDSLSICEDRQGLHGGSHVTGVVTVVAAIAGVREHPVVGRKGGKD